MDTPFLMAKESNRIGKVRHLLVKKNVIRDYILMRHEYRHCHNFILIGTKNILAIIY